MEQKHELKLTSSCEHPQVTKSQLLIINLLGVTTEPDNKYFIGLSQEEQQMYNNAALTCTGYFNLFKPNFKSELIAKLLVCVAWGQQDKTERLLKTSPELMLEKTTFTDCSGRTFSNISAFEFVLWALDARYMVNMMFNCLPKDENGLKLAKELEEQYYHHQEHGVTYTLEGKTITEKHFDFSVLINALQAYVDNFDKWDWEQREAHWCKVVGMAQRYVPAHVMQHYCDPNVPFYPLPKFEAEQFIRTLKFYNYVNGKETFWAGITSLGDSGLGENFGITAGVCGRGATGLGGTVGSPGGADDLLAITALCKVRASDYLAIPFTLASLFDKKAAAESLTAV